MPVLGLVHRPTVHAGVVLGVSGTLHTSYLWDKIQFRLLHHLLGGFLEMMMLMQTGLVRMWAGGIGFLFGFGLVGAKGWGPEELWSRCPW